MYSFEKELVENEEIIYKGSPCYKNKNDLLTIVSMVLVIAMEIVIYISVRKMITFDIIRAFVLGLFAFEDVYLYFSLRAKRIKKEKKSTVFYCLTNKRIMTYNEINNSLIIEKIDNCDEIVIIDSNKEYGSVCFYNNKEEVMIFDNILNYKDICKKANLAKEELKKLTTN